ncbi:hypothetical protein SHIRM173S_05886 [Streptomyces hirsutus]
MAVPHAVEQRLRRVRGLGVARAVRVVRQRLGVGRGHTDVVGVVGDGDVQRAVGAGGGGVPGVGPARPLEGRRDPEGAVRVDRGLRQSPVDPLVEHGLGARVTRLLVVLGDPLHGPRLEAEPPVGRRVVVHRLLVVVHAVERRRSGRRARVAARPAVGGAARDGALVGLQPAVELQLPVQGLVPVLRTRRRLRLQGGVGAEGVGREGVLVAAVRVAGADAPGPARGGVGGAAPGVVPGHQIVRGVLAGTGRQEDGLVQFPTFLKYLSYME